MDVGSYNEKVILPSEVSDAILEIARRELVNEEGAEARIDSVVLDDEFENDGEGESDVVRTAVRYSVDGARGELRLIAKRWEPTGLVSQLLGVEAPVELLLHVNGDIEEINHIHGLQAPIVGSVMSDGDSWIILDDVSEELDAWRSSDADTSDISDQLLFLDRLAAFHVAWEDEEHQQRLRSMSDRTVAQNRRLRSLELASHEPMDWRDPDPSLPATVREAMKRLAWAADVHGAFLYRLPLHERTLLRRLFYDRSELVAAAAGLPRVLLHGDLKRENIGIRRDSPGDTILLIDWEQACYGSPALDVINFIGAPMREMSGRLDLVEYYREGYLAHHGTSTNDAFWKRSCDVAFMWFGVTYFPGQAELLLRSGHERSTEIVGAWMERIVAAIRYIESSV